MSTILPHEGSGSPDAAVPAPTGQIMSLTWEHEGPVTVVLVSGEVDMSNAHLLVDLATYLARGPAPQVILDLADVRFVDLHALTALVEADRLVRSAAGGLTLRRPPRCVTRLLALTGTADQLRVDGDVPRTAAPRDGPTSARDGSTHSRAPVPPPVSPTGRARLHPAAEAPA